MTSRESDDLLPSNTPRLNDAGIRGGQARGASVRAALRSVLVLVITIPLLATLVAQAFATPGAPLPRIQSGSLSVQFSDESGNLTTEPSLGVADASPRMPPVRSVIRIDNSGTLPARYTLKLVELRASRLSLTNVLHARVMDPAGTAVYEGRLSGLSLGGRRSLEAGESAQYTVEVSWPDDGEDVNQNQGQSLSFDIQLVSVAADG